MEKQQLPLNTSQSDPLIWFNRFHAISYTLALFALFYHRSLSLLRSPTLFSFISFLILTFADLVLSLLWILTQAFRWSPVRRRAYAENLKARLTAPDLPALDVFICTADPYKEPPVDVVNTALSAMAFDYPAEKISVYVSDDGGSKLTLFAFMEAAGFARHWIPFCKENSVKERNPQAYFANGANSGFPHNGWRDLQAMYERMKARIESAVESGDVAVDQVSSVEYRKAFERWTVGFTRKDHPAVIEVLVAADKDTDGMGNAMPNIIYMSREKSTACHHHFKAGALNSLLRVSSLMSNAPIILNLDCDVYSTDPEAPLRALCFLLDPALCSNLAFVQFPQIFPGINKNDIYGNEYKRLYQINPLGMDGSWGPNYLGTGCFFQRRAFAGPALSPPHPEIVPTGSSSRSGGGERIWRAATLEAAERVAGCHYEKGTEWGSTIGFRYGSLSEDFFTGYSMQCEGWRSVFYSPEEPSFVGDFPATLNDLLSQCKRWSLGLLQAGFSCSKCPITYGIRRASFITGMSYAHNAFWPLWSIPITIYALLPQFALLLSMPLFPKASDPWIYLYTYLFLGSYGQDMIDFIMEGGTFQRWWSDQRIWLIKGVSSFLFGLIEYLLQRMGISVAGFNITSKVVDDQIVKRYKQGAFEFGTVSPFFVTISAAAVISLISLIVGAVRAVSQGAMADMLVQLFISGFVVVNSWPIYEGMFLRKDSGKMPKKVTALAGLLGCAFYLTAEFARKG
ncbi:cellulose synthase-like protein G3 [Nymphaea colorata]|nr:cellulose synthase-like protein G3 [Nymphaea colorata]XP_031504695.1 cellulose synthase-like protein G3 [Nymphaea colorata]XP_049937248.1 cellulose synthase-like protein G3 [Nymphaea colorata]